MQKHGTFITLEGGEGGGKSTQAKLLQQALLAAGIDAIATREPGGTPQAERIRDILVKRDVGSLEPLTEALLLFAGRHEHIVHKIRPALTEGKWVICDRFADSTRAMQGAGMGLDPAIIETLYDMTSGDLRPDLTFIFDIDPEQGLHRANKRLQAAQSGEDRYERMSLAFHQRLRQGFLDIAARNPDRCVVIDATLDVADIHAKILETVQVRFGVTLREVAYAEPL